MNFAVITFPGSNCDRDVEDVIGNVLMESVAVLRHDDQLELDNYDCVILPGGFSYGDYLRSGAIARFSPMMERVIDFANQGGLVLGICNGFQILLEAGLLPGAMKLNDSLKFVCRYSRVEVVNQQTPFTGRYQKGEVLQLPVAHGEGNYYIDQQGFTELQQHNQIVLRYAPGDNPNGSIYNIAGICNRTGNVFGLMPHPERCAEDILGNGSKDGYKMFASIVDYIRERSDRHDS